MSDTRRGVPLGTDEEELLTALGLASAEELFAHLPPTLRTDGLELPPGRPEQAVVDYLTRILQANRHLGEMPTFLGAGVYDHFVPAAVRAVTGRAEFYTAYTPYQAELSQGILQALFEYQSVIAELTGLPAVNTSMYDASTALGEAALMARRATGRSEVLVPRALLPDRRAVLENYAAGAGLRIRDVPYDRETGTVDLAALHRAVSEDTAAVYVEQPNFFGVFEEAVEELRAATDGLLIVGANPLALAVTKAPADYGADVVLGEGQVLGNAPNFGGPLLGVFACRKDLMRRMPGRVIGMTRDAEGRRAFAMTLQTREQHIRQERAMSNICTNETLLALAAVTYVALLGPQGLKDLAEANLRGARSLARRMNDLPGCRAPLFRGAAFNEFVAGFEVPYATVHRGLLARGVHGGLDLGDPFPELGPAALFATTERHGPAEHEALLEALEAIL